MKSGNYIPERGDIIWISFNPQTGHEQSGHRPALVLSPQIYNSRTGMGLFCPITSRTKNYAFEVKIKSGKIHGVVLSDHIKNLDWTARKIKYIGKVDDKTLQQVTQNIILIINPDA